MLVATLGWIVLLVIAGWGWLATAAFVFVGTTFSGRIHPAVVIPFAFACFFSWLCYDKWPFNVAVSLIQ